MGCQLTAANKGSEQERLSEASIAQLIDGSGPAGDRYRLTDRN